MHCPHCHTEVPPHFKFCGACGSSLALGHESPDAQRRQLTVMFCDLVGSTALSEQLDPEELQAVVRTYQEVSAQVIERYEGYIAQYLGARQSQVLRGL